MSLISVNDALGKDTALEGEFGYFEGLLLFEFENVSLNHWPRGEQVHEPDARRHYQSSIWIEVGDGA